MNYQTIIFDLDGTLLNTIDDLANSVNYVMKSNGWPEHSVSKIQSYVGNGIYKLIERSVPVNEPTEKIEKAYEQFREYYKVNSSIKTRPYEGIMELLNELKMRGYHLAIVSNKADFAVIELADYYFKDLFDIAIGERKDVPRKPAPDMVKRVIKQLEVNKESVLYVGDSEVDYDTAINAELDCVLVSWGFRSKKELEKLNCKRLIDQPSELLHFL